METNYIISMITVIVSLIAGEITKKYPNINKKKIIPIQNIVIGIIVAFVYWIKTKNFNFAIAGSGLFAGGLYDVLKNLQLIQKQDEDFAGTDFEDLTEGDYNVDYDEEGDDVE